MAGNSKYEMKRFKREIPLADFIASYGYEIRKEKKCASSCPLIHPSSRDELVVFRDLTTQHWLYWSRADETVGDIIDFVRTRLYEDNYGKIRKMLRPLIGENARPLDLPKEYQSPRVDPSTKDRTEILLQNERTFPIDPKREQYLTSRGLADALTDPRFSGKILYDPLDPHKNIMFPHVDNAGVSGFETVNLNFQGFSDQGTRGLWISNIKPDDNRVVIAETGIDALSYHILSPHPKTRYISIGGELSGHQCKLFASIFNRMPENMSVIIGTDSDPRGDRYAEKIIAVAVEAKRIINVCRYRPPDSHKDWNEQLEAKRGFPSIRPTGRQQKLDYDLEREH